MNCWQLLGIDPDSDKKTIKIAYSKLLKQTRPDEDPEGFKELHDAYQQALAWIKESKSVAIEGFDAPLDPDEQNEEQRIPSFSDWQYQQGFYEYEYIIHNTENETEKQDQQTTTLTLEEEDFPHASDASNNTLSEDSICYDDAISSEQLAEDWDSLFAQAVHLIEGKKLGNKAKEWGFIADIPSIVDIEFRQHAGNKLFAMIGKANSISLDYNVLAIKSPALNYLNDFFHWEQHWQYLESELGEELTESIFPYLASADTAITDVKDYSYKPLFIRRSGAFIIDATVLAIIFYAIAFTSFLFEPNAEHEIPTSILALIPIYYMVIIPLFECSKWQATLGKFLFSIKVVNKSHKRLKWYHALHRGVISMFVLGLSQYSFWVNFLMGIFGGYLLQDYLSSTRVIRETKD